VADVADPGRHTTTPSAYPTDPARATNTDGCRVRVGRRRRLAAGPGLPTSPAGTRQRLTMWR
jgi:hypothetical protein